MNNQKPLNVALALVGLLALGIYVLACTSFSPDDTKILYPAFDAPSGAIGMAVYDRETKGTEMLFLPLAYEAQSNNIVKVPCLMRAEWVAGGREIVVSHYSWQNSSTNKENLDLALIPYGVRKPIRTFRVPASEDAAESLLWPICIVGERVFLQVSKRGIARLDVRTGAIATHQFEGGTNDVTLYPAPDGKSVFCFESSNKNEEGCVVSRLNPDDFRRTPLMLWTNNFHDEGVIACDKGGRMLAFLGKGRETNNLLVLRDGRRVFGRSLDTHGQERCFGNAILNPNGNALWATFARSVGTNATSYGLMEIPFSDAPPHELTLISNVPSHDPDKAMYFQVGISHDGKTAAIASTYLACTEKEFNSADCALFLVDLSKPEWPVTKVPIPMPAERPDLPH